MLRALEPRALEHLLERAIRRELDPEETIISQGDERGDFAICLLSGGLRVAMASPNGREIILHYCRPGEVVGEIALLDAGPRTANVSATTASSVLIIPASTFLAVLEESPQSMVAVMRELARRLRQLNLVVESDRSLSMAQRLARALLRLVPQAADDGRLHHIPSQSELGAFAGLARENVSRLLSQWEEAGIIERSDHALTIKDLEYLETLAEI